MPQNGLRVNPIKNPSSITCTPILVWLNLARTNDNKQIQKKAIEKSIKTNCSDMIEEVQMATDDIIPIVANCLSSSLIGMIWDLEAEIFKVF